MMNSEKEKNFKKILLMGLDNSGKTSILISLSKNANILSFCSLKPTKHIAISNIDTGSLILNIWDFGGQEVFRSEYLENLANYLEEVDKIIFVIDIQDIKRYNLAIEYLQRIFEIVKREEKEIKFTIFFHKYDPNLIECEEFKDIDSKIEKKLIKPIKEIFSTPSEYEIDKTCIYSVFQKVSIIK